MKEIWKDVKEYEGVYKVSNLGNVRSLDRIHIAKNGSVPMKFKGRLLKPGKRQGYEIVNFRKNSEGRMLKVHRLVGVAFIDNPNNLPQINHKDGNRSNNVYTNLEWSTQSNNMNHAYRTGLIPTGENHINSTISNKKIVEIKNLLKKGYKKVDIAKQFNISDSYVCRINKNIVRTYDK